MNFKNIFLVLVSVLMITTIQAQVDYSKVKADQLSDAQVKQMMQRADEMKYGDAQLQKLMISQGMDQQEALKLKERVDKIRGESSSGNNTVSADNSGGQGRTVAGGTKAANQPGNTNSRIFGADLFSNSTITFEPNMKMATPKNYVIGPDDELLLDLTGDNEASYKLRVSPEGFISMEYVGRVAVGGLTIEQATSKIRSAMAGTYPALQTGRSQIALNLGNIRSIKVIINGEVNKPGTYTLPSLATVFNALYASGGPNDRGSFRNIQVIRGNRVVSTIDIYDFLINGFQTGNIRLQDQDVIYVPVYQTRVDVVGEVKRSAIFEVLPHETFVDILKFAGGFSEAAYSARVKILQNTPIDKKILDLYASDFFAYHAKNGDKVFVEPILNRINNKVKIAGAVFRPGIFELSQGLTLSQLIKMAGGLRGDAFMNRGYIIRLDSENTALVPFNVSNVMKPDSSGDILLQREDVIQISSIFDLRDEYKVSIGGEVRNPGTFSYSDNMSVKDLVQMAGGFKEGATPMRIEVSRRVSSTDLSQKSAPTAEVFNISIDSTLQLLGNEFLLKPFDIVSVRLAEGFAVQKQVRVEGEVLYPGIYTINYKNERISDVIRRAGGLTAFAFTEGASLKRPGKSNGDQEEEQVRLLNLQRLRQTGAKDSIITVLAGQILASDMVGIELDKILNNPFSRHDLILENGDIIRIPSMIQTVKVTGEVLRPISVVYVPGKPFEYYINSAGGFTKNAFKRGSFVTYANGSVQGTRMSLFVKNYPQIKPGADIAVPRKADREKISSQGWIGVSTAVATLAALVISILKK